MWLYTEPGPEQAPEREYATREEADALMQLAIALSLEETKVCVFLSFSLCFDFV
jgi:hypothetical protein